MDSPITSCPGCGKIGYEWVPRDQMGWCLLCGYYEYYSTYTEFLKKDDDEPQS